MPLPQDPKGLPDGIKPLCDVNFSIDSHWTTVRKVGECLKRNGLLDAAAEFRASAQKIARLDDPDNGMLFMLCLEYIRPSSV